MLIRKITSARAKFQKEENYWSNLLLKGEGVTLDFNMVTGKHM